MLQLSAVTANIPPYFLCWCLITRASTSYAKTLTLLELEARAASPRSRILRETTLSLSRQNVAREIHYEM